MHIMPQGVFRELLLNLPTGNVSIQENEYVWLLPHIMGSNRRYISSESKEEVSRPHARREYLYIQIEWQRVGRQCVSSAYICWIYEQECSQASPLK